MLLKRHFSLDRSPRVSSSGVLQPIVPRYFEAGATHPADTMNKDVGRAREMYEDEQMCSPPKLLIPSTQIPVHVVAFA